MKIPFKMKTKDCKTPAGYVAEFSKSLEEQIEDKGTKKLCRKAKDSAKKFDKIFCKLIKNVKKRDKEFNLPEDEYKNLLNNNNKIAEIYKDKFESNEKAEYDKAHKDMKTDFGAMMSEVESISKMDNTVKEILKSHGLNI